MPGANSRYRRREGQVAAVCLLITILIAASPCLAATKVFEREYTYPAGEADSKLSSRTVALAEVKRLLLEELGTYLESVTEVKNFRLTKDQITALTAGIVRVEVLDERWDGKTYWLKARVAADPDEVAKSLDSLKKDREKAKELEEIKKRADALWFQRCQRSFQIEPFSVVKSEPPCVHDWPISSPSFPTFPRSR